MRRKYYLWFLLVLSIPIALLTLAQERALQSPSSQRFWSGKDVETGKRADSSGRLSSSEYKRAVSIRPRGYIGPLPLRFKSAEVFHGKATRVLYYDFGEFVNLFVYGSDGRIVGARTHGTGGIESEAYLLAEARIRYATGSNRGVIEIEEAHYAQDGRRVFHGKSRIGADNGVRATEITGSGQKRGDYYFLWPVGVLQ
jgi:hypothetical protein